jgi:hypothetical protein
VWARQEVDAKKKLRKKKRVLVRVRTVHSCTSHSSEYLEQFGLKVPQIETAGGCNVLRIA